MGLAYSVHCRSHPRASWVLPSPEAPRYAGLRGVREGRPKSSAPLRLAVTQNMSETATIFGLTLHLTVGAYIVLLFMPTYLGMVTKLSKSDGLLIVSAG